MKRLAFVLLLGCGPSIVILPPNDSPTKKMCNRAYECQAIPYEAFFKCDECLLEWADKGEQNLSFIEEYADKMADVTCEEVSGFASLSGVAACISD